MLASNGPRTLAAVVAKEEGRRLFKVASYDSRGTKHFWRRLIEGLSAVDDIDRSRSLATPTRPRSNGSTTT